MWRPYQLRTHSSDLSTKQDTRLDCRHYSLLRVWVLLPFPATRDGWRQKRSRPAGGTQWSESKKVERYSVDERKNAQHPFKWISVVVWGEA